ncbi:ankyrin repeat and SOCS box protein 5 isoform 2-T2 [Spinachia spinachia]
MSEPTEGLSTKPLVARLSNVYLSILALFCFKLFVKISLNLLTYFYIVRGNRKEAARISAEFYDHGQKHGAWAERSPLHDAARHGHLLALKTLVSQGHSVNALTMDHVTPLHEACVGDHAACARALVDAGANVNASTMDGVSPLFNACAVGSVACTEMLLENGATPQSFECHPSAIHEATSKGHYGCVEALVTWGADVDADIPHLGTALYAACVGQELECARRLLREAAERDFTAGVKLLLDFGADINSRNAAFQRPVDVAAAGSPTEGFLLTSEVTPRRLNQLCRQGIRSRVGRDRLRLLSHLPLPNRLRNYLQYQ